MRKLNLWTMCLVAVASCTGADPAGLQDAKTTNIKIHPSTALVAPNGTQQFAVTPSTVSVVWSVQEASGGTVTQTGLYTAPSNSGTFHVLATASPTVQASATVTVTTPVAITAPSPQVFTACVPGQLQATVTGSTNTSVVWGTIDPTCGTIVNSTFTPARVTGTCGVTVAAVADPTQTAAVTLQINPEQVIGIAVLPATVSVKTGGTQQFSATVTTSCGTFPAGG